MPLRSLDARRAGPGHRDPRLPGLFHAVTSNGYTLGPLVGRITADLVRRGETDRDVVGFSIARFGGEAAA